ncbi:MAG: hypothetical protein JW804_05735 [Sedimentisphaerales bacterium]|nr:hypothetical protein [Sedimentisphaerales bacterium]
MGEVMNIRVLLVLISGPLFLISIAAYVYVQLRYKPKYDADLDDYYWEFEEQHPALAKYNKLSNITFAAAVIAALVLFAATFI